MKTSFEDFNRSYHKIFQNVWEKGKKVNSRNGMTSEILNYTSELKNPYKMFVGSLERNINPFFLLIEAMWIAFGRNDLATLLPFNPRMKQYSDDGKTFHGAYGERIRDFNGIDQLQKSLELLSKNSEDRRVVISIWDPQKDLDTTSNDIPCNDMIMLKIRQDGLHLTVQNRSNDVLWGLPTNIFQFSYLGQVICSCLNIKYASQTHNSQSLHVYTENEQALEYYRTIKKTKELTSEKDVSNFYFAVLNKYSSNENMMDVNRFASKNLGYSLALELIDAAHETVFDFFQYQFHEFCENYLRKEKNTEVILRELKLEIEGFFKEETTSNVYNDGTKWYRFFCYCTYYLSLYLLFKDKTRLSPEQRIQVYKSLAKSHLNNYHFPSQFVRLGSNYLYNLIIKESEVFSSFLPAYNKNFETDGLL